MSLIASSSRCSFKKNVAALSNFPNGYWIEPSKTDYPRAPVGYSYMKDLPELCFLALARRDAGSGNESGWNVEWQDKIRNAQ